MKKYSILKLSMLGALAMTLSNCQTDNTEDSVLPSENVTFKSSEVIPGSYIVVYKNTSSKFTSPGKVKSAFEYKQRMGDLKSIFVDEFKSINLKETAITQTFGYALKGFTANLTEDQLIILRKDPRVQSIEQDQTIQISPYVGKPGGGGGTPPAQQTPYGTTRVGGGSTASTFTAWIIDTGIDLDHPDLNVDVSRSATFLGGNTTPDDQNGHGSHVAGTVGAKNNSIGSLGVAPGTLVVAVRVLDRRGSGSTSGVIAGVDYVAANGTNGDVANMSLGGGVSTALDDAVIAASSVVKFALAAGNETDNANNHSPARANGPNIYTISAMNSSDNWASFSNFGNPPVDYCAPGVSVYSTWKDGGYNTISGTSMAAPHAAGVLLLGNPSSDGTVNGDPDGTPDPIIYHR